VSALATTTDVRAQLSLEFMLYTALVAASAVSAVSAYLYAQRSQVTRTDAAYAEELFALINANMAYGSSVFYAVVPADMCNATAHSGEIDTGYGTFRIDGNLTVRSSACDSPGRIERLELEVLANGTYALEGDPG